MNKKSIIPRTAVRALAGTTGAVLFVALPGVARADMLSGGLLGHLFRGDAFTGPRVIDLLVLGLVVFLVLRFITGRSTPNQDRASQSRSNQQDTPPAEPRPQPRRPDNRRPDDEPTDPNGLTPPPPGKPDMYTMAQATWAALKTPDAKGRATARQSAPSAGPGTPPADASPEEEFLAGAKMAYRRILEAMADRDFNDLAAFVAPDFLEQLKGQLPASPEGRPDILLVDAELVDSREDAAHTIMTVDFKALVREPGAPRNAERRERWRFSRDNTSQGANWLLIGMERQ